MKKKIINSFTIVIVIIGMVSCTSKPERIFAIDQLVKPDSIERVFIEASIEKGERLFLVDKQEFRLKTYKKIYTIIKDAQRFEYEDKVFPDIWIDVLLKNGTYLFQNIKLQYTAQSLALIEINGKNYWLDEEETKTLVRFSKTEIWGAFEKALKLRLEHQNGTAEQKHGPN